MLWRPAGPLITCWLVPSLAATSSSAVAFLGSFTGHQHGVEGLLAALGRHTLVITEFHYDGLGPAAFFLAGRTGLPGPQGTVLAWPGGPASSFRDPAAGRIGRAFRNETVILQLPGGLPADQLAWVSVYCRQFSASFGEVMVETGEVELASRGEVGGSRPAPRTAGASGGWQAIAQYKLRENRRK
jgi:hypothetical protein